MKNNNNNNNTTHNKIMFSLQQTKKQRRIENRIKQCPVIITKYCSKYDKWTSYGFIGKLSERWFIHHGSGYSQYLLHRIGGPACIFFSSSSNCIYRVCWYKYGKLHRTDGPAEIYYFANNTKKCRKYWFLEGIKYHEEYV
jgi:hypothetical protein